MEKFAVMKVSDLRMSLVLATEPELARQPHVDKFVAYHICQPWKEHLEPETSCGKSGYFDRYARAKLYTLGQEILVLQRHVVHTEVYALPYRRNVLGVSRLQQTH